MAEKIKLTLTLTKRQAEYLAGTIGVGSDTSCDLLADAAEQLSMRLYELADHPSEGVGFVMDLHEIESPAIIAATNLNRSALAEAARNTGGLN